MSRALDNTVELISDSGRIFCSGFIMKGAVITAAHCVEGDLYVKARMHDGHEMLLRVVRLNVKQDYAAAIAVDGTKLGDGIPLASGAPRYGDEVFVLGHSKGDAFPYSLTRGIVSHPDRLDGLFPEMRWMQHDAGSIGGNSGGPVMNKHGRLVGLTSFGALGRILCGFPNCPPLFARTHTSGAVHYATAAAHLAPC